MLSTATTAALVMLLLMLGTGIVHNIMEYRSEQYALALSSAAPGEQKSLSALGPTCPPPTPCAEAPKCDCQQGAAAEAGNRDSCEATAGGRFEIPVFEIRGPLQWTHLPDSLKAEYTLGGAVQLKEMFLDDRPKPKAHVAHDFDETIVNEAIAKAQYKQPVCFFQGMCDRVFRAALAKHSVAGKAALVLGSVETGVGPWAEAYFLANGASSVTTAFLGSPSYQDPRIKTMSMAELSRSQELYDIAVSYSALEHEGMGRFGDPLHPNADIIRMQQIKGLLRPGGQLWLGVAIGNDTLVFNAHRIYGPIRFPKLIEGWTVLDTFGGTLEGIYSTNTNGMWDQRLLHVLSLNSTKAKA